MSLLRLLSCGLVVTASLVIAGPAVAGGTHVYLLRGLFNVSVGLDALAGKLGRLGIAASVYGHGDSGAVAEEALSGYKRGRVRSIVLIGHSLGAGAVVEVARQLDEAGVPVSLLIALDPVAALAVSPNVRHAVDYYVAGSGYPLGPEPGFHGQLTNVDVGREPGMDHMAVQATDRMHARMIGHVRASAGGSAPGPALRKSSLPRHAKLRSSGR